MKVKRARKFVSLIVLVVVISASLYFYLGRFGRGEEKSFIKVSGTVDADIIYVASLVPGKVSKIAVDEGERVKAGTPLAFIDDEDYRLTLRKLKTTLAGAEARYRMIRKGAREEDIARVREKLRQAKLSLDNAKKNCERAKRLYEAKVFPRKKYDDAYFAYKRALAGYRAVFLSCRSFRAAFW
ncbi:MAG: biotin/lipoyl-binding protein [Synergistetes bacterium]|nr:biotin/lipoyl-binding protein [Synergistota bacterium]